MRQIISILPDQIRPDRRSVLETQGIPPDKELSEQVEWLLKMAMEAFLQCARPVSIISGISIPEFEAVYRGGGSNEKETPLEQIVGKADDLALFAVTIGAGITERIDELFKANEFALGSMLDSVASAGTDKAAEIVENHYLDLLFEQGKIVSSKGIMSFSPGYCGWHMSGQKKLFEFLRPEDVGIKLLNSFLMKPLKSISGIMVFGNKQIFNFTPSYSFCRECKSKTCRQRLETLLRKTARLT